MNTIDLVLFEETAHLSQTELDLIARRRVVATELVRHCPAATEQALSLKLLSFGDCPRWVCVLIAKATLQAQGGVAASAAA